MAVLEVNLSWLGDLERRDNGEAIQTANYQVILSAYMAQGFILDDSRLPQTGELVDVPGSGSLFVRSVNVVGRDDTRTVCNVRVIYANRQSSEAINETSNPLDRPAEIRLDSETRSDASLIDAEGRPITTVLGEAIEGFTLEVPTWIFNISYNVTRIPEWFLELNETLNADDITIRGLTVPKRKGRLSGIRTSEIKIQTNPDGTEVNYFTTNFQITYRNIGWDLVMPNWGFMEYAGETTEATYLPSDVQGSPTGPDITTIQTKRITDKTTGEYISSPSFLDANGRVITPEEPFELVEITDETPNYFGRTNPTKYEIVPNTDFLNEIIWLRFPKHPTASWSAINRVVR